jgi:hypothetical protein
VTKPVLARILVARESLAASGVLHFEWDSAISRRVCGRPVPMGAYSEKASGGMPAAGTFLKRRRWMGGRGGVERR